MPTRAASPLPTADELVEGVLAGRRAVLSRAITLVESRRPDHAELAQEVLNRLLPRTGEARRVGITGVPGVGKSTFIETLGSRLLADGHRLAVLAVDPSSTRTGGSILGDKTRMPVLASDPRAYVRPSPASGTLGGVARMTREIMLLCEAAGHDVVLVETVGVGQSETVVAEMVDFFLALMLPGAGDELQGIKKGIVELADMIAVNKADGPNALAAQQARRHYQSALRIIEPSSPSWNPPVMTISSVEGTGIDELWSTIERHRSALTETGELAQKRCHQQVRWFRSMLDERLRATFRRHPAVKSRLGGLEKEVARGALTPTLAVERAFELFLPGSGDRSAPHASGRP